ncbi:MAG: hypothetical protein HYU64_04545 [Armatimonadetes bacterium]|nr:hypothetical protein [Armatimonadota bacterium]
METPDTSVEKKSPPRKSNPLVVVLALAVIAGCGFFLLNFMKPRAQAVQLKCEACGAVFQQNLSGNEKPPLPCPKCGKSSVYGLAIFECGKCGTTIDVALNSSKFEEKEEHEETETLSNMSGESLEEIAKKGGMKCPKCQTIMSVSSRH